MRLRGMRQGMNRMRVLRARSLMMRVVMMMKILLVRKLSSDARGQIMKRRSTNGRRVVAVLFRGDGGVGVAGVLGEAEELIGLGSIVIVCVIHRAGWEIAP